VALGQGGSEARWRRKALKEGCAVGWGNGLRAGCDGVAKTAKWVGREQRWKTRGTGVWNTI